MGELSRARRSHVGSEESQEFRSPGAGYLVLPIFGSNFDGHRVVNHAAHVVPGEAAATPMAFAGESTYGWGVHPDGTVDCLDVRSVKYWTLGVDRDEWDVLWSAEANNTELAAGIDGGRRMLIERLVVNLQIQFQGVTFIPDPREWAVMVTNVRGSLEQAYGTLVPKPAYDEWGAKVRAETFRRQAKERKRCL